VKVQDTLSGRKEEFIPRGDEVKMYVCGVTPYDESHIGHAMSYIIFDAIRRYLKFCGYKVRYVQNITDIDDKIIERANKLGVSTDELAGKFTDSYFADMDALNITRADVYPRATGEIDKIIEVIAGLIDKGHAYPVGGSVYFRVDSDPDYGKLSHRTLESMKSFSAPDAAPEKESPMDFALWKATKPGEPAWDSPWGKGRPGWHIECSAMSLKYLGDQIDIHGGGQDLVFPHHENEIAQSEGFTGAKPFVKYWLHNGLLKLGEEKMSKSLGNLVTIKEILAKHSADALRVFVLNSHYRSPLTYSEDTLEAAEKGVWRLRRALSIDDNTASREALDAEPYRRRFIEAMDDDFNTPKAIAVLFDLARAINQASRAGNGFGEAQETMRALGRDVLGLKLEPIVITTYAPTVTVTETLSEVDPLTKRLVEERIKCRKEKKWQRADEIRNKLAELGVIIQDTKAETKVIRERVPSKESLESLIKELGIVLEDTPKGTVWKRNR